MIDTIHRDRMHAGAGLRLLTLVIVFGLPSATAGAQGRQVECAGLEPGERLEELAPAPTGTDESPPDHGLAYGHVRDAFSGRPIPGATVEVWSEEINGVFGGYHRFGEARSAEDGRFVIQRWSGGQVGDKVRVLAKGYLTLSTTGSDLQELQLFPAEAEPFRLRVLDSRGRPIAGARITSTYSCSHDVPAFDLRTDARGLASCPEIGLQQNVPELRVRARGYAAVEYLDIEEELGRADRTEPLTVVLPRRRPFAVRVLDDDGGPLAETAIYVIDDECYHVPRTDQTGLLRVESRYGAGELSLDVLMPQRNRDIAHFIPPRERVVSLRPHAEGWPDETPVGRVRVDWGGRDEDSRPATTQLHNEGGWIWTFGDRPSEKPQDFPAGSGFLVLGGAFSGHAQEIVDFDLAAGALVVVRPTCAREPEVTLRSGDGVSGDVWIEAGDETLEDVEVGATVSVPAGRPLRIFQQDPEGPRLMTVETVTDGMVIDLASARKLRASPPAPAAAPVVQELRFSSF